MKRKSIKDNKIKDLLSNQKGIALFTTIILARILNPSIFGLFALAFVAIDGFGLFKSMGFDIHSVNVITPFPQTPLWQDLDEKYGIFDLEYRHYDAKHLVWNHPNISKDQMIDLYKKVVGYLNNPIRTYTKALSKIIRDGFNDDGLSFLWKGIVNGPINSMSIDDRKQYFFTNERSKLRKNLESHHFS